MIGYRKHLWPGERVVLRHLPVWLFLPLYGVAGYMMVYAPVIFHMQGRLGDPNILNLVLMSVGFGAPILALTLLVHLRVWTLVTDRRVLRHSGLFRAGAVEQMRLRDITSICQRGPAVVVAGDRRSIDIPCPIFFASRLVRALERAAGGAA